ncbi:hypothetical protein EV383_3559 [Pseudonocardia sediminis]|uniref:Uncharacterized protein n=1 Tax=Pseudonocardia sediminis TaxID=1397368 RepID=A0A4Q7UXC5_PSEST|nr:hypothetical protein [Pseudonocardia sediminis]RZT86662.1 hypothetical protein EV383_3559 [Pseudonocardia sediminis]
MTDTTSADSLRARALATALEPFVGSVYFAPEAHAGYAELGFDPSPGPVNEPWGSAHWGGVAMTDGPAYMTSRGSLLGQVHGAVVAAAFGVFAPAAVIASVELGWSRTDAATIGAVRTRGALAQLVRVLGERPAGVDDAIALLERAGANLPLAGRPMYAGVCAQGLPDVPIGRAWRLAERLREHRGDGHVVAFTAAGFGGCAIQVLTERVAGMPPRTYSRTRGWTDADLDAAERALHDRGLIGSDGAATDAGRAAREQVERATDALWTAPARDLGDDLPRLVAILQDWNAWLRSAAAYYPSSPQEATLAADVQRWMREHGLHPFPGVPDRPDPAGGAR